MRLDEKLEQEFNACVIPMLKALSIERVWDDEEMVGGMGMRHVFVDTSEGGFGCIIYRRVVSAKGKIHVTFICGRSHVIPTNSLRASHHGLIPWLELTAAVKGVEADEAVKRSLPDDVAKKDFWSDLAPVLAQIYDITS